MSYVSGAAFIRAFHESSPGSSVGSLPCSTMMMCLRSGRCGFICSTFARWSGDVTSTFAPASASRSPAASGPNAENSGPVTQPAFSVPKTAAYSSGTRSMKQNTRSPFAMPSVPSTFANWFDIRDASA